MIHEVQSDRFEEIYRIYEASFPDVERRTRGAQKALFKHPYYHIRAMEEDGVIEAFVAYWTLPSCLFIEHLATNAICRGRGIGRALMESCIADHDTERPVFLEIEPVSKSDPMTGRRAGFYERLGFSVNRFLYFQMPLKERDRPIPLWIMSYPVPVSEAEFAPYKKEIYEYVYGAAKQGETTERKECRCDIGQKSLDLKSTI